MTPICFPGEPEPLKVDREEREERADVPVVEEVERAQARRGRASAPLRIYHGGQARRKPLGEVVGMVLCAGLGTRLRPLTDACRSRRCRSAASPLVRWSLALLAGAGVRRAVVNVHHLPDAMAAAAHDAAGARSGIALAVSQRAGHRRDRRRAARGTHAPRRRGRDPARERGRPLRRGPRRGARGPPRLRRARDDGAPPADARGRPLRDRRRGRLRRRPPHRGRLRARRRGARPWHFSGVHVLSPALLDRARGAVRVRREPARLPAAHGARGRCAGSSSGYWNDLGTPARYLEANGDVLLGRVPLARFAGVDPFAADGRGRAGVRVARRRERRSGARLVAPAFVAQGAPCRRERSSRTRSCGRDTALAPGERVAHAIAAGDPRIGALSCRSVAVAVADGYMHQHAGDVVLRRPPRSPRPRAPAPRRGGRAGARGRSRRSARRAPCPRGRPSRGGRRRPSSSSSRRRSTSTASFIPSAHDHVLVRERLDLLGREGAALRVVVEERVVLGELAQRAAGAGRRGCPRRGRRGASPRPRERGGDERRPHPRSRSSVAARSKMRRFASFTPVRSRFSS